MRLFGSVNVGPFSFGASGGTRKRRTVRRVYLHSGCDHKHVSADAVRNCEIRRGLRERRAQRGA
jgi:hypothetical protein